MRAAFVFLLNFNVALYFVTGQPYYPNSLSLGARSLGPYSLGTVYRERRGELETLPRVVDDCIMMAAEAGEYFYKSSTDESTTCGLYLIAHPSKRIEITFERLDVPCEAAGLVSWLDGWELNGEYFPSPRDHPRIMDDRFTELCGTRRVKEVFISNQNVAMLHYRVPAKGKGFTVLVRHIRHPTPCNILVDSVEDNMFTLRNHGKAANCSLTAVYSAGVKVVAHSVGVVSTRNSREVETGTVFKCKKRGRADYVELGGSTGLDSAKLQISESFCGLNSSPALSSKNIFCEVTTVRLVSGGNYENSVTIGLRKLSFDDIASASHVCAE